MEQEINYLIETIESLNWRINELLADGCEGEIIDGLIHQHSMLENILNAIGEFEEIDFRKRNITIKSGHEYAEVKRLKEQLRIANNSRDNK